MEQYICWQSTAERIKKPAGASLKNFEPLSIKNKDYCTASYLINIACE